MGTRLYDTHVPRVGAQRHLDVSPYKNLLFTHTLVKRVLFNLGCLSPCLCVFVCACACTCTFACQRERVCVSESECKCVRERECVSMGWGKCSYFLSISGFCYFIIKLHHLQNITLLYCLGIEEMFS